MWTLLFRTAPGDGLAFTNREAPVSPGEIGAALSSCNRRSRSVANVHPAEARDPPPAARSDHHDAAEATPIAMTSVAVTSATHSTTFAAAGGRFGRNERGGGDAGDRGDSENRLADHGSFSFFCWMCSHILPVSRTNHPRGSTLRRLKLSGIVRIAAAPGCASGGPVHPLDQERLKSAVQLVGRTAPWLHAPACVTPCRASARSL